MYIFLSPRARMTHSVDFIVNRKCRFFHSTSWLFEGRYWSPAQTVLMAKCFIFPTSDPTARFAWRQFNFLVYAYSFIFHGYIYLSQLTILFRSSGEIIWQEHSQFFFPGLCFSFPLHAVFEAEHPKRTLISQLISKYHWLQYRYHIESHYAE